MIKPADAIAALTPPVATVTAGQINSGLGVVTGIVSLGYLLWRWRRDYLAAQREDAKRD
ncbi:MAG: hypothetical protein ACO3B7_04175 [Candidatus Limnocylindrus sp.]|jgi:hypothetical protein